MNITRIKSVVIGLAVAGLTATSAYAATPIISITLPGLHLVVDTKAPAPLIKANEIAKVFSEPENIPTG